MKIVAITISNRDVDPDAYNSILRLRCSIVNQRGTSDVALARNLALSQACRMQPTNQWDCALLVDDDMVFMPADAQELIVHAMQHQRPTSACYVGSDESLMAAPWKGRWLTGLGLMAIPMVMLLELEARSESFKNSKLPHSTTAFCWSGMLDGNWISEDYQLCMRLGGVDLLPVRVGHVKRRTLTPSNQGLAEFLETTLQEAAQKE